jgi:hypothetical protein
VQLAGQQAALLRHRRFAFQRGQPEGLDGTGQVGGQGLQQGALVGASPASWR